MNVILACASGASSSYMVRNIRRAAEEAGLKDFTIRAISEYEVDSYIDCIDVLMLGPHLKNLESGLQELGKEYGVPVQCLSQTCYGTLNGPLALEEILACYQRRGEC